MRIPAVFLLSCGVFCVTPALAIEAGDYLCTVENAVLTAKRDGQTTILDAPEKFTMTAFDSPVSPEILKDRPPRRLNYYKEGESDVLVSIRIEARLFSTQLTNMQSSDGVVYVQDGNVFRFSPDGKYLAHGYLALSGDLQGVAIYQGACSKA